MYKNKTMRAAALLLALTMVTSCFVGGTFAKYTTTANGTDKARVAYWGFHDAKIVLNDLFATKYINDEVNSAGKIGEFSDIIAPGTTNSATFSFKYDQITGLTAPEVAYKFTVSVDGSAIDQNIKANDNIKWQLSGGDIQNASWGTWDELMNAILTLSGTAGDYDSTDASPVVSAEKDYGPNALPTAFDGSTNEVYTISWKWAFDSADSSPFVATDLDTQDTAMGNLDILDDVTIKISITATQIDSYTATP